MSKIITICGSMQFSKEMVSLKQELECFGWIVFTPDLSEKPNTDVVASEVEKNKSKRRFISNHFNRIKNADAILVANYEKKGVGGYIGSNTLMEIAVAYVLNKKIFILNKLESQPCEDEVEALTTSFLDGSLKNINK